LGAKPVAGGGVCFHYDSTFNDASTLSPERMFGDANVVVIPSCAEDPASVSALVAEYQPYLQAHGFVPVARTSSFFFFSREKLTEGP